MIAKRFASCYDCGMGAKKTTKQDVSNVARLLGSRGGKKRVKNMTPEQLSEANRKAARARWSKAKTQG
jgi:hypothetical protein